MSKWAYYNDNEAFAAAWLRELIKEGLIPDGEVDQRSVLDVRAGDLAGFRQCHFFAGIGGWARAFLLAGIHPEEEAWSGSCPCQPLSLAGSGRGHADERHLWPAFYDLIAQCRPPKIFGEQVTSPLGREWLAGVRLDLEGAGYAVGAANLPACSKGAPHIRYRNFWVAYADGGRFRAGERPGSEPGGERDTGRRRGIGIGSVADAAAGQLSIEERRSEGRNGPGSTGPVDPAVILADANGDKQRPGRGAGREGSAGDESRPDACGRGATGSLDDAAEPRRAGDGERRPDPAPRDHARLQEPSGRGAFGPMGDPEGTGLAQRERDTGDAGEDSGPSPRQGSEQDGGMGDAQGGGRGILGNAAFPRDSGHAYRTVPIYCADGKWRRVPADEAGQPQSEIFPLAHGIPNRVGALRGAGNAIHPEVAAEFIRSAEEACQDLKI